MDTTTPQTPQDETPKHLRDLDLYIAQIEALRGRLARTQATLGTTLGRLRAGEVARCTALAGVTPVHNPVDNGG